MMKTDQSYTLADVTTQSGYKLFKGGVVKLLHIFPAGRAPDSDLVVKYYGCEPGSSAFKEFTHTFKEDRLVLERESGKVFVLPGKYAGFLSGDGIATAPDAGGMAYTDPEAVLNDLAVGQEWTVEGTVENKNGQVIRFRIESIGTDESGTRQSVQLSYRNQDRAGTTMWCASSHRIPLRLFANNVVKSTGRRLTAGI